GGPHAAGGWRSRTWSSGPSGPAGGCPLPQPRNWSGPGTPGRPSDTSAARSANSPATPATRSGHANDHPGATARTRAVQETGRRSGADGSIAVPLQFGAALDEDSESLLAAARVHAGSRPSAAAAG